jgi:hypothetical protein
MLPQPIGNTFLFTFLSKTKRGMFAQKNAGRIYIPNAAPTTDEQGLLARWVRVEAIGPDVKDFKAGDIVLLEPLKWTIGYIFGENKFWKSDETAVMATTDEDESIAIDFNL